MAETKTAPHFLVLLCGGTGPRLWPLSRSDNPKQFLPILSPDSLMLQGLHRCLQITNRDHVFIVSNSRYSAKVKKEVGDLLAPSHLLFEPQKKNTAQAVIFTLAKLKNLDPGSIVSFLPSDHFIPDLSKFKNDLKKAKVVAQTTDSLVAIGIKAKLPHPSYGYLLPGKKSQNYLTCKKFFEKPSRVDALKLIVHGAVWNSGIYTAKISTFLSEFKKYQPAYFKIYQKISSDPDNKHVLNQSYRHSPTLSLDHAISEKTNNLVFFTATFRWNDIGEWKSIYQESIKGDNQISVLSKDTQYLEVNSQKCLVSGSGSKLIGLVGVNNLAVIDTPDALLICNIANNDSYSVRDLVGKITKSHKLKKYFSPHD